MIRNQTHAHITDVRSTHADARNTDCLPYLVEMEFHDGRRISFRRASMAEARTRLREIATENERPPRLSRIYTPGEDTPPARITVESFDALVAEPST